MLLFAAVSDAADLTWTCAEVASPADARPWKWEQGGLGAPEAGDAALDMIVARVDADCVADCADPYADCPARTCVTAAGDVVSWEATSERDDEGYGGSSSTTIAVRVEPPGATAWDWAEIEHRGGGSHTTSSTWGGSTSWSVSWGGTLVWGWPADGSFYAASFDGSEGEGELWDDGACAWRSETTVWGERVEVGGVVVEVLDHGMAYACEELWNAGFEGLVAYVGGVRRGLVDPDTWATAGTDADGDGWPAEGGDCDDADTAVNCRQVEAGADGVDQDCDGVDAPDLDGDGFGDDVDCDDREDETFPGAWDTEGDGVDRDCDGADGMGAGEELDTGSPPAEEADTVEVTAEPVGGAGSGGCTTGPTVAFGAILAALAGLAGRRRS